MLNCNQGKLFEPYTCMPFSLIDLSLKWKRFESMWRFRINIQFIVVKIDHYCGTMRMCHHCIVARSFFRAITPRISLQVLASSRCPYWSPIDFVRNVTLAAFDSPFVTSSSSRAFDQTIVAAQLQWTIVFLWCAKSSQLYGILARF